MTTCDDRVDVAGGTGEGGDGVLVVVGSEQRVEPAVDRRNDARLADDGVLRVGAVGLGVAGVLGGREAAAVSVVALALLALHLAAARRAPHPAAQHVGAFDGVGPAVGGALAAKPGELPRLGEPLGPDDRLVGRLVADHPQ